MDGAEEAFVAAAEGGWEAQPGLALVRLAQGDPQSASLLIRDALEHPSNVPSKELPPNTPLRRAPLLAAQVEIELALGNLPRAQDASSELAGVAATFGSKPLLAAASAARAQVSLAEGDARRAREAFEEAVRLWDEIDAPYETALARMGLANACRTEGHEDRARLELRSALAGFERVGAARRVAEARRALGTGDGDGGAHPYRTELDAVAETRPGAEDSFLREGDDWTVTFLDQTVRLADRKGLQYLARLLASPGLEIHVLDLAGGRAAPTAGSVDRANLAATSRSLGDAGPLLDPEAKEAYRRRLAEIEEDIDEAEAMGDAERAEQAVNEREFLARELARAVGLGGRDRRASSASERARASVTRAVRDAMARIHEHHPPLGEHLERTVRTGTYCVYLPDSRAAPRWRT